MVEGLNFRNLPMIPPTELNPSVRLATSTETDMATLKAMTIVLCPRLKYRPHVMGKLPGRMVMSERVALSMALH